VLHPVKLVHMELNTGVVRRVACASDRRVHVAVDVVLVHVRRRHAPLDVVAALLDGKRFAHITVPGSDIDAIVNGEAPLKRIEDHAVAEDAYHLRLGYIRSESEEVVVLVSILANVLCFDVEFREAVEDGRVARHMVLNKRDAVALE